MKIIQKETVILKSQHGPTKNMLGQTTHIFFIKGVDW